MFHKKHCYEHFLCVFWCKCIHISAGYIVSEITRCIHCALADTASFTNWVYQVLLLSAVYSEMSSCSTSLLTFDTVSLLNFTRSGWCVVIYHYGFNLNFHDRSEIKHLSRWLLAICRQFFFFFLWKAVFTFAKFSIELSTFFLLIWRYLITYSEYESGGYMYSTNFFSLLMMSFYDQKFFNIVHFINFWL